MNIYRIPLLLLGLATLTLADDAPKNYAVNPVPRDDKWMVRHQSFNEKSKKGDIDLVFLGDSITQGWEGAGKEALAKAWAPLKAANFGIGGDRTEHVIWRLQHGNFDGIKPKTIVLMIGTNNTGHKGRAQKELNGAIYNCTAEQTAEGVKTIIGILRAKMPDTKILLLGIFPRGANDTDAFRKQNEATNAIISKLDDGAKVFYMDIGKTFLQPDGTLSKEIMPDLLHLSAKGYDMWVQAIEGKVKELLK